ncbi:MAG: phytanoyl-CoA dioxygenase family protein [Proteobacteria bacterium]|nr:phytanoyl-CoA dioxygenase family protein [Pseudomonadota bacterium]
MVAGFDSIDFHEFHNRELPRRLAAGNAGLAARGCGHLPPLGIALEDSGETYTYVPREGTVEIVAGDAPARTVIAVRQDEFEGMVHDCESAPGLIYGGRVVKRRGDMMDFVGWDPVLRAMYQGRPIYDADALDLRDRRGEPLDPAHGFRPEDDLEDMAHFLRSVGYLFVREVFSAEEVAAFRAAGEVLRGRAVEGDQLSWWGLDDRGESVLCRVIRAGDLPAFRGLPRDPRLSSLVDLADTKLVPSASSDVDGVTVLWKNPRMREGLSDLPWHRDCGMGGHSVMCPTMVCSIFLEANTPEAGELRFLPGSWQKSWGFAEAGDANAPQGVAVPARPGDLTLHYGDGMHFAPPPTSETGPFRSCVLVGYAREGARHHRGERHYNDVLLGRGDGQVEHMTKVAGRY